GAGRLRGGAEPHAADERHRALRVAAGRLGLREAQHGDRLHARRPRARGARGGPARAPGGAGRTRGVGGRAPAAEEAALTMWFIKDSVKRLAAYHLEPYV